jgi:uncharacterized membrane-anchored protein YhcB (DUF1043 family)
MSMPDQDEMRELRDRLRGALEDIETHYGTIAALRETLRAQDEQLEHITAERDRLRVEKRQFNDFLREEPVIGRDGSGETP